MIGRIAKRLLRRLIRGLIRARLVIAALVVLLLIAGGLAATQGTALPNLNLSLPGPKRAPDATEAFLKGNQTYSPDQVCSSFSDDALEQLRSRGVECRDLYQRQLDVARQRGASVDQINYVGGFSVPDGSSLQFYVVRSRGPLSRSEDQYVTYIFTLDRSGKIVKVQ